MTVRDGYGNPFSSVDEFFTAFRNERFPNFYSECRLAFKEMRQVATESSFQFFFRFRYLLVAMKRDIEEYHDDFLNKLLFPEVVQHVRFQPRYGRTLQQIAMHCNDVENKLGCRKNSVSTAMKSGNEEQVSMASTHHGQDDGGEKKQRDVGRVASSFARADTWGLKAGTCWHCFDFHSMSDNDACLGKPCLFCGRMGHRSFHCWDAPSSREEFQAKLKPSK